MFSNSLDFLVVEKAMKVCNYSYRAVSLKDCRRRTLSNHCLMCMTMPILLTLSPWKVRCYCVDHVSLWFGNDVIVNAMESRLGCNCINCMFKMEFWSLGEVLDAIYSDDDDDDEPYFNVVKLSRF